MCVCESAAGLNQLPIDPKTDLRYHKVLAYTGFGLWWAVLLAGAFAPQGQDDLYMLIAAGAYALVVVIGAFFSGYYRKIRAFNSMPENREDRLWQLWVSIPFTFAIYVAFQMLINDQSFAEAAAVGLFVALATGLFTWFAEVRRTKRSAPGDGPVHERELPPS